MLMNIRIVFFYEVQEINWTLKMIVISSFPDFTFIKIKRTLRGFLQLSVSNELQIHWRIEEHYGRSYLNTQCRVGPVIQPDDVSTALHDTWRPNDVRLSRLLRYQQQSLGPGSHCVASPPWRSWHLGTRHTNVIIPISQPNTSVSSSYTLKEILKLLVIT